MDKINDIKSFQALRPEEKRKIYDGCRQKGTFLDYDNIQHTERKIKEGEWYQKQSKEIKRQISKYKPWQLYHTTKDGIPVRLYGFAKDHGDRIIYLVATMEDDRQSLGETLSHDQCNSLSLGQIYDIALITPITWEEIDEAYLMNLTKAQSYGGDMIFLKPEMFLILGDS